MIRLLNLPYIERESNVKINTLNFLAKHQQTKK